MDLPPVVGANADGDRAHGTKLEENEAGERWA